MEGLFAGSVVVEAMAARCCGCLVGLDFLAVVRIGEACCWLGMFVYALSYILCFSIGGNITTTLCLEKD